LTIKNEHTRMSLPPKFLKNQNHLSNLEKDKDTAIPLQAWTGPEGSSSFRYSDFKTIGT
jgi:hypothetical protein